MDDAPILDLDAFDAAWPLLGVTKYVPLEPASLAPEEDSQVATQDNAKIERRPTDVRQAIHRRPGELVSPDFVRNLDTTLVLARAQFTTFRRYAR